MEPKIVAIIPARGGSKGIPRKNIKLLNGNPLISYVIKAALKSQYIDEVYVSTDDEEIAEVSKKYGAKVIMRPAEFATDEASSESVLLHFTEKVTYDYLIFLQCTAPLTTTEDIDCMINNYLYSEYDTMVSVCEGDGGFHATRFIWTENAKPIAHSFPRKRRQELPTLYKENGAIYIMKKAGLLKYKDRFHGKIGVYIMPKYHSFEIDNIEDFEFLNKIMKARLI